LRELFGEAKSLGAQQLLVAGGEPFLRPDLPEVLSDAISIGLEPAITTKFPVSLELARRLKTGGLKHLCLSVDSIRVETNQVLMASNSYWPQVEASVQALKEVNLSFSIEFVATAFNHHEMEEVCEEAASLGALVFLVVPFEPVLFTIGEYSNADMTLPSGADLNRRIDELKRRFLNISVEAFEDIEGQSDAPNCDIGKTKLLFDPYGRVHRCYKLLHDKSLYGSDLKVTSIAAAWHEEVFNGKLLPDRDEYSKESCGKCGGFDACHDDGRCIFQSNLDHQTYFDQDRDCAGPH
jgi:radical SAM protein with 4Fe4S-binding SPASM domain